MEGKKSIMVYIVMGVAGCGKTTIASLLGERLGIPWYDADDYHSPSNIGKMQKGISLDDSDRQCWLEALAGKITEWSRGEGAVLACSALKEKYRAMLKGDHDASVCFIYLKGSRETILERMKNRKGHFFPPSLLDRQFEDLEEPDGALTLSIEMAPMVICREIEARIGTP
jgi:carbohydrate kinase (thermoresistant glucokinase family)